MYSQCKLRYKVTNISKLTNYCVYKYEQTLRLLNYYVIQHFKENLILYKLEEPLINDSFWEFGFKAF